MADQVHVALIGRHRVAGEGAERGEAGLDQHHRGFALGQVAAVLADMRRENAGCARLVLQRSEEHTSELQSLMRISYAVFCLKKKKKIIYNNTLKTRQEN